MDKIVSIQGKKSKPISPIHLVALIDLSLFALLSFRSGVFVPMILMLGVTKAVLTYLIYAILKKLKMGEIGRASWWATLLIWVVAVSL